MVAVSILLEQVKLIYLETVSKFVIAQASKTNKMQYIFILLNPPKHQSSCQNYLNYGHVNIFSLQKMKIRTKRPYLT